MDASPPLLVADIDPQNALAMQKDLNIAGVGHKAHTCLDNPFHFF